MIYLIFKKKTVKEKNRNGINFPLLLLVEQLLAVYVAQLNDVGSYVDNIREERHISRKRHTYKGII